MALAFWSKRHTRSWRRLRGQSVHRFRPRLEALEALNLLSVLTVTNTHDHGPGSLRDDIAQAQPGDTIIFNPALAGGTVHLTGGELDIAKNLTIAGLGPDQTTISGTHHSRVFAIAQGTQVTLTGMTITHGRVAVHASMPGTTITAAGAGIANAGSLTLSNCVVTKNSIRVHVTNNSTGSITVDAFGGGISNTGTLTVIASTISFNGAGGSVSNSAGSTSVLFYGGGLYSSGALTLIDSTVANNQVHGGDNGSGGTSTVLWEGGGIYSSGMLTVVDSTLIYSFAATSGGGIFNTGALDLAGSTIASNIIGSRSNSSGPGNLISVGAGLDNAAGTATLTNCTIANNFADAAQSDDGTGSVHVLGGGVYNAGTLALMSCTIAGNVTAATGTTGDMMTVAGGGLFNDGSGSATVSVHDTLVAGNRAQTAGSDAGGSFASQGFNLIGITDGSTGWTDTDLTGSTASPIDPLLGSLRDNGGPTQTMALQPGSPAIDAGDNTGATRDDQRGAGYPRIVNGTIDIGAFEVQAGPTDASAPRALADVLSSGQALPVADPTDTIQDHLSGNVPAGPAVDAVDRLFAAFPARNAAGLPVPLRKHAARHEVDGWHLNLSDDADLLGS